MCIRDRSQIPGFRLRIPPASSFLYYTHIGCFTQSLSQPGIHPYHRGGQLAFIPPLVQSRGDFKESSCNDLSPSEFHYWSNNPSSFRAISRYSVIGSQFYFYQTGTGRRTRYTIFPASGSIWTTEKIKIPGRIQSKFPGEKHINYLI